MDQASLDDLVVQRELLPHPRAERESSSDPCRRCRSCGSSAHTPSAPCPRRRTRVRTAACTLVRTTRPFRRAHTIPCRTAWLAAYRRRADWDRWGRARSPQHRCSRRSSCCPSRRWLRRRAANRPHPWRCYLIRHPCRCWRHSSPGCRRLPRAGRGDGRVVIRGARACQHEERKGHERKSPHRFRRSGEAPSRSVAIIMKATTKSMNRHQAGKIAVRAVEKEYLRTTSGKKDNSVPRALE